MMNSENKGYALAVINGNNKEKKEKVYLKPMALYVPDIAAQAVSELISTLSTDNAGGKGFILTVTNNNNGVSVDSEFATLAGLAAVALQNGDIALFLEIVKFRSFQISDA